MHEDDRSQEKAAAQSSEGTSTPRRPLTPAAQRALAEAAERRAVVEKTKAETKPEFQGPAGPEPTRYGDWERKGIASDF